MPGWQSPALTSRKVPPSSPSSWRSFSRWYEIDDDDPARALVSFAREHQITQIVIGSMQSSWWYIVGGGPVLRRVIHEVGAFGIDVHHIAHRELPPAAAPDSGAAKKS